MKIKKIIKRFIGKNFPVLYSRLLYRIRKGERLNLKNPQKFNEKLMWLKIYNYYDNKIVWKCSDKYQMREYAISKGVSEKNLPKIIKTYTDSSQINYNKLPNKFALKCSHGCGFNIICTSKDDLNIEETNKKIDKWMKTKFGYESAENHYTHIKPCIIAEEYIGNSDELPYDYKLYCFNGVPKLVLVCSNRSEKLKLNYYDLDWNELPYGKVSWRNKVKIDKPKKLDEMIKISKMLSKDFPFVRIDFYETKNRVLLGEMTFTPAQCMAPYYSDFGDEELSKLLDISSCMKK